MKQTKVISFIEASVNVASGFLLSLVIWQLIAGPLYGYEITIWDNIGLTSIFTFVSVIRGYLWRRFFNAELHQLITKRFKS